MKIYEKIFARLDELHMSQIELSRRTGIATSTISDWRKKKINPQADKLVVICTALNMSLTDLLCSEEDKKDEEMTVDYAVDEDVLIEKLMDSPIYVKTRVLHYYEKIINTVPSIGDNCDKKISIIQDVDGNNIVLINDILFK